MNAPKLIAVFATTLACALGAGTLVPARASAISLHGVCNAAGLFSGLAGKACGAVTNGGRIIGAGKKLLSGHIGGAAKTLLGEAGSKAGSTLALAAMGAWVIGGAKVAMDEAAKLIDHSTRPQLQSSWFSSSYWRMAGIAAVLTLPFLFAAAVQAIVRSDLALLARAALGYLPLAVLAVSIVAPLTTLLLAATDQMSALVSGAAGGDGPKALVSIGGQIGTISALDGSPFLAFLVGLFVAAAAFVLWMELLIRQAAVYVVVLMLPLAFAAMVWPARRVWAVRAVELLVALILSKFAIVAVLSLAAAALAHGGLIGSSAMISGFALVTLAAFAPWAVVRLLPLAEVAGGAAGPLRTEGSRARGSLERAARGGAGATMLLEAGGGEPWPYPASPGDAARAETERLATLPTVRAEPNGAQGRGEPGPEPKDSVDPGSPPASTRPAPSDPDGQPGRGEGLPEPFQHGFMTWRPHTLGLDEGWPPPTPRPDDEEPAPPGPPGPSAAPPPPEPPPPSAAPPPPEPPPPSAAPTPPEPPRPPEPPPPEPPAPGHDQDGGLL